MTRLRVGLIGTGFMGKCHALAWTSVSGVYGDLPEIELACLADADIEVARRQAASFRFARATGDWRSLVADPSIDVVSVTTPNHLHAEMAVAALQAGKHVWCEKPMATTLEDAARMLAAARASGKVAILGYNYIQNPAIQKIAALIQEGAIGDITHLRVEMDEDFMADAEAPFSLRSEARAGYGALDDFGVHALSLVSTLIGPVRRVIAHMAKPYARRPLAAGGEREVETYDIATLLVTMHNGASGMIALNRAAWGRKGRIAVQIFGARGTIAYDQERLNEVQLFRAGVPPADQGFTTILMGPAHPPYGNFIPAPGHQLGFNDLKVIECRQLVGRILGEPSHAIGFEEGFAIERTLAAAAESFANSAWTEVG
ncbi:Predicted dehydrogenase [Rhizobiales bacterium GAS113]|nr:Predicted dehydrogenase [Rhizobiales bacterium GAS113]